MISYTLGGGSGGGLLYKNDRGCSPKILKKTPKRYQDPVLWVWLEIFLALKRYQF